MSQPSKKIGKKIAKPLPSLPHSKLNLHFFPSQPWQPWRPASCSAAEKLASAAIAAPAAAKE